MTRRSVGTLLFLLAVAATAACSRHPSSGDEDGGVDDGGETGDATVLFRCGNATCDPEEDCHSCPADCPVCTVCPNDSCEPGETCESCAADCGPCGPSCGDASCDPGETCYTCPADCPQCTGCPNGTCDPGESCETCAADCGLCEPLCGNANCESSESCDTCPADCPECTLCPNGECGLAETCATCAADCGPCGPVCGNGNCEGGEDCLSCPPDCAPCPPACWNGTCEPGEDCFLCPEDCGSCVPVCGDGVCDAGEDCLWCAVDCGTCEPVCPNAVCETDEDCMSCPQDCGSCPPPCGDGSCEAGEDCVLCPEDCGACPTEEDVLFHCPFNPMQWWRGQGNRDITFVAFGDPHASAPVAGCPVDSGTASDQNELMRQAINSVDNAPHVWPAGSNFYREGQVFDHVRGVLMAGDLTQAGSESIPAGMVECREYTVFRGTFGRCGDEGLLEFPTYEGYGNHDFPRITTPGNVDYHPVIDYLDRITAADRPGAAADLFDDPSPGTGHYAWRWDDIWFVHLNLKPGYAVEEILQAGTNTTRLADPHHARLFLKEFLLAQPNSSTRQIVIVSHYPLSSGRIELEEKELLCRTLQNARNGTGDFPGQKISQTNPVLAVIHGHTHHTPQYYNWTCPSPYQAIVLPHFDAGTPWYAGGVNDPGMLHFTIFRIGSTHLEVVGVSAPAMDPTGAWGIKYQVRLGTPISP